MSAVTMGNNTYLLNRMLLMLTVFALVWVLAEFSIAQNVHAEQLSGLTGKQLVDRHCTRCHLAPNPTNLPKEYWPIAVHWMGPYLGMKGDEFPDLKTGPVPPEFETHDDYSISYVLADWDGYLFLLRYYTEFVLPQPIISKDEFKLIREYFVEHARPASDMIIRRPKHPLLKGFIPTLPKLDIEPNGLALGLLVDEVRRRLYVGRAVINDWVMGGRPGYEDTDDLVVLDLETGKRIGYTAVDSDPISFELTETGVRVGIHGEMPIERGNGQSQIVDWEGLESNNPRKRMLVNGLHRIIRHHTQDLNGDGLDDIVVSGYGDGMFQTAGSSTNIYWQTPEYARLWQDAPAKIPAGPLPGALRHTVLLNRAGIISHTIADFNLDGKSDIVLQVAQGKQQLIVYINKGNESFAEHIIAEYPPSHGGNSIEVGDFNGDGLPDIAALNGDHVGGNHVGPGRPHPRPHHSIRLYKNNGDVSFTQSYIYPMHGATKSVVNDFDGDGDLDIAAISLMPDWSWDEPETFVYLENQGDWKFVPASIAKDFFGVWSSIATGDVNGDNKTDIILGLGNFWSLVPEDWTTSHKIMQGRNGEAPTVMLLLNNH